MVRKLGIGCAVVIGALIVLGIIGSQVRPPTTVTPGGGGTAVPTTGAAQAKVGDKVTSGNWEYTVTKVDKTKTITWSEFGNKTDATGTWLIVSITLKNIGNQNFGINTFDFELRDGANVKYDTSSKLEAFGYVQYQKLTPLGEQVPPGLEVKSALLFDINPAATGLKLVLKQAGGTTIALE